MSKAIDDAIEVLAAKAAADPALAAALRALAQAVLAAVPEPSADEEASAAAVTFEPYFADVTPEPSPPPQAQVSQADVERLVETFQQRPAVSPAPEAPEVEAFSFDNLAATLRLKAEASAWLATHGYTIDARALAERTRLIGTGRARSCYLWMLNPQAVNPDLGEPFRVMAESYTALAEALELWRRVEGSAQEDEVVQLVAEAQSALVEAVQRVRGDEVWHDPDQAAVFQELRRYGKVNELYLDYMTLDGRADPDAGEDLRRRIASMRTLLDEDEKLAKARKEAFNQLKYHANQLHRGEGDARHHWQRANDAVEKLQALGVPASDPRFREPLRPILDLVPDDLGHEALARVVRWVVHEDESALRRQGLRDFKAEVPNADVQRLRGLLEGRTLLLIGGHPKPESISRLEESLACKVEWLESRPHQSPEEFKPALARADVLIVVLLIRWSSHVFGNVQAYCAEGGKLFVRAPGGYSVNTLAHTILEQVGKQLATRAR